MISPYGNSFSDYINQSLQIQLSQNDLYSKDSNYIVSTEIIKNDINIWGFSEAYCDLKVKFEINEGNRILYSDSIELKHDFPSHFVGQIAIENGINNYPIAVKKLIKKFLNDQRVINLLKK